MSGKVLTFCRESLCSKSYNKENDVQNNNTQALQHTVWCLRDNSLMVSLAVGAQVFDQGQITARCFVYQVYHGDIVGIWVI